MMTNTTSIEISIIIVSWNVAKLLADCLDSIRSEADSLSLEVWVVDNASSDDSVAMLRDEYPWVHVIANSENCGFARGNNQAIAQARGRFIMLLNPDTVVGAGALRQLVDFAESHPQAGIVGPNLRRPDGSVDLDAARRLFSLHAAIWFESLRLHRLPWIGPILYRRFYTPYDYGKTQVVDAISGAAMLTRREIIASLGGLNEDYLHCGEDIEFCHRVCKAGMEIWYIAGNPIIHYGGQSNRSAPVRTNVNRALSNERYFVQCYGPWHGWLYRKFVQLFQVPMLVLSGIVRLTVRRESRAEFGLRLRIARALIRWRPIS